MANTYDVSASDGKNYTVTTSEHHSDHTDDSFKKHLRDAIITGVTNVATGIIVHEYHLRRPGK